MYEMVDPQVLRQRRREMLREAEQGRLAGASPADRKRRRLGPAWEPERIACRLLKPLRRSREILVSGQGASDVVDRARRKKYG